MEEALVTPPTVMETRRTDANLLLPQRSGENVLTCINDQFEFVKLDGIFERPIPPSTTTTNDTEAEGATESNEYVDPLEISRSQIDILMRPEVYIDGMVFYECIVQMFHVKWFSRFTLKDLVRICQFVSV